MADKDTRIEEIVGLRQIEGEPFRRWFCSSYFHLFLFEAPDGSPLGFHLCYDVNGHERVLVCMHDSLEHRSVDEGNRPGRIKATPIYTDCGDVPDLPAIEARFRQEAANMPHALVEWICSQMVRQGG